MLLLLLGILGSAVAAAAIVRALLRAWGRTRMAGSFEEREMRQVEEVDWVRGGRWRLVERYANVQLLDQRPARPLAYLRPGYPAVLRVDVGALKPESRVESPVPFPDDLLPREDVTLAVVLSSNDLAVGRTAAELKPPPGATVEQRLRLPADGGPAVEVDSGRPYLDFALLLPSFPAMEVARARVSYLYRNTVLQSQRLEAGPVDFRVTTDFTLSATLAADVETITRRPRVTVLTNESSSGGRHEFTVRAGDADGAPLGEPITFAIAHDSIGNPVANLRKQLTLAAPTARRRRRDELIRDLQRLAPLGWDLHTALHWRVQDAVRDLAGNHPDAVLQVAIADGSTFTLPWSFVYDIFLPSGTPPERLDVCPVVSEWDGQGAMVGDGDRTCPRAADADHAEGLLCPFGFWGFRYGIEVLASTDRPKTAIHCTAGTSVVIGETERGIDKKRRDDHIDALRGAFAQGAPGVDVCEARGASDLRALIHADLPILYFLCHGERRGNETLLGLGESDRISPKDLMGWVDVAARREGRYMWTDPQPFVFINACQSLAIAPEDLVSYVAAFIGKAHAVGVVGTEIKVEQNQAMDLAEAFFGVLLQPGATVEDALRQVRLAFLADGNLLGLAYTPYCFADLAVAR